ncbi:hypothetical protein AVEN_228981-1 [Araneus ventricosus]|uniref:Uncharacterized protein n=1 Tax=Araneus ventricosus TaxID=182803 RepID=A0A4Y2I6Z4_ARAVE|nr:hypothetical protein AVEN_228981-1 [Araneus ventricosus]
MLFPKAKLNISNYGITCNAPSDEDRVSLIKEKKDFVDDSSSGMENGSDASAGPLISDAKAAVNILQNYFATETEDENVLYSFLVIDKNTDEMHRKSRCFQQKITAYFHTLEK